MFDRLEKPFLTVETGEAYQPTRLIYKVYDKSNLAKALTSLKCIQKNTAPNAWTWYWKEECNDLHFESIDSFYKNPSHDLRIGTLFLKEDKLYINLPSFKRSCLAVSFFHKMIDAKVAIIEYADFINKVFGIDERLPHGFTELFSDEELNKIIKQRKEEYKKIKIKCEQATSAEMAFSILSDYTKKEASKRLPYVERYLFDPEKMSDAEMVFLSFYIFLHSREIVAIKRWLGDGEANLSDVIDESIDRVFGGVGLDIIE